MVINVRSVYYLTEPEHETWIYEDNIEELKKQYDGFKFINNDHYIFTYKNLNVIISKSGYIQLSLMSTLEPSEALPLLEKIANKINSVLGIEIYSKKVMI